jgi:hypothetical protein
MASRRARASRFEIEFVPLHQIVVSEVRELWVPVGRVSV